MSEPHLRASDSDRAAVATALGEHMAAGRLTLAEYEERLARVYETKTLGGLASLTADLPATTTAPAAASPRRQSPAWAHGCGSHPWAAGQSSWRSWLTTALIVLAIWTATSVASGELLYFWPMWVIGPWGAVLLAQTAVRSAERARDRGRDTGEVHRIRA